jgi:hypothetical protein
MKQFLFVLYLLASGGVAVNATPPIIIDKALSVEIKKQLNKTDYSILPIAVPDKYKVNGKFFSLNSAANQQLKYAYMGRVITNRSGNQGENDGSDYLDYIILYSSTFAIQKVKVVRFSSEHGAEVCSAGWLMQFVGHTPGKSLTVGKNVDAVSGATATVNTFTFDIQSKTYILKEVEGGRK